MNGSNQFDFESGVLLFQMTVTASDRAGSVSYGSGSGDRPVDLPIAIVNRVSQDLTVVITDVNDNRTCISHTNWILGYYISEQ